MLQVSQETIICSICDPAPLYALYLEGMACDAGLTAKLIGHCLSARARSNAARERWTYFGEGAWWVTSIARRDIGITYPGSNDGFGIDRASYERWDGAQNEE